MRESILGVRPTPTFAHEVDPHQVAERGADVVSRGDRLQQGAG